MFLSIVIPVYNVKDYLEKCVDSVISQVGEDCEIILVNDGSTDGESPALCDMYAEKYPRYIKVIHKQNGGIGDARNAGINEACGKYLCFIDSDDYVLPGYIDEMRRVADDSNADIIQFGYKTEKEGTCSDTILEDVPIYEPLKLADYTCFLAMQPMVWYRIWKRSLFVDNGILFPLNVWHEDVHTTPKLFASADTIVCVPNAYYAYVQRPDSVMHSKNIERCGEIISAFEDIVGWFKKNDLFRQYYNALSEFALLHVLIFASVRVARVSPKNHLLQEFKEFVFANFPDCLHNPEVNLSKLHLKHRAVLGLVVSGKYRLIFALFKMKDAFN